MGIIDYISQPWSWYASGIGITIVMTLLLFVGNEFGVSSNLRTLCSICGAGRKVKFFDFDWKSQIWNLVFILGAVIGGYIASTFLKNPEPVAISASTIQDLQELGVSYGDQIAPLELFSWQGLATLKGFMTLVVGGFFVGFGARYAGGCTSGHAISGISNLQIPSIIAVVGFFIGGLIMTFLIMPLIF